MPTPDPDAMLRSVQPGRAGDASLGSAAAQGYDERIAQLMRRLLRLRRRLHAPGCPAEQAEALRDRMAWLHAAIFAISAELDCSY